MGFVDRRPWVAVGRRHGRAHATPDLRRLVPGRQRRGGSGAGGRGRLVALIVAIGLVLIGGPVPATASTPPRLVVPSVGFVVGGTVTTNGVPVIVRWGPASNSGRITRYRLRVTRSGEPWRTSRPRPDRAVRGIDSRSGSPYRFVVRAAGPGGSTSRAALRTLVSLESEAAPSCAYRHVDHCGIQRLPRRPCSHDGRTRGARDMDRHRRCGGAHRHARSRTGASPIWSSTDSPAGSIALTAPDTLFGRVVAARVVRLEESAHAVGLAAQGGTIPRIDLDGVAVLRSVAPTPLLAVGDVADCNRSGDELTASLAGDPTRTDRPAR